MVSPHNMTCNYCRRLFGVKRKPFIGNVCDHYLCAYCVECSKEEKKCRKCGESDAFVAAVVNYAALQMIEEVTENIFEFYDRIWYDEESFSTGLCTTCRQSCQHLRICLDCGIKKKILRADSRNNRIIWNTPFGIVRLENWKLEKFGRFCGDCFLDEKTHHTEHKTALVEFLDENSKLRMQIDNRQRMLDLLRMVLYEIIRDSKLENEEIVKEAYSKVRSFKTSMKQAMESVLGDSKDPEDNKENEVLHLKLSEAEAQRHRLIRDLEQFLNIHCGTKFETKLQTRYPI